MGQQSISTLDLSFCAKGAVLSRRAVGFDGAQATLQGQQILGISPRPVADKMYSEATASGTAVMEAGEAFPVGAELIVDAQGRAIVRRDRPVGGEWPRAVRNPPVGYVEPPMEFVIADAMEAAGFAGEFVEVLLRR